jgi:ELWxxDGT repeat protein
LWVSDGTADGTSKVKDCKFIYPGTDNSTTGHTAPIMRVGNKVFFKGAASDANDESLWVTDGTEAGTKQVFTLSGGAHIDYMINYYNQKLFFAAGTAADKLYPYMTDGVDNAETHTKQVSTSRLWNNVGGPCQGYIFYRGDGCNSKTLYSLDAVNWDTYKTFAMPDNYKLYYPISGVEYKGRYYFGIENALSPNLGQLAYLDLSVENPAITVVPTADGTNNVISEMMVCAGTLWWINQATTTPFKIDNTTDTPGPADSNIGNCNNLRNLNGTMLFNSYDSNSNQNLIDFWGYIKNGYDAATEADNLSLNFDTPFPNNLISAADGYKALPRAIAKGGSMATDKTTWFNEHYKLIFPKQNITWTQTIPSGYSVTYVASIGDRKFNGTCANGTNTLTIYGGYNQSAAMTFTFKDATGTAISTEDKTLGYNGVTASNGISETTATGTVYKNGHLVCALNATDDNSAMTSYYVGHRYKEATGSSVTNADNYDLDLTPINSYNIVTANNMWTAKAFQMTPKMYDLYMNNVTFDAVTGKSNNVSGTIYYLISPHYLFVNEPFLEGEMTKYNINTVNSIEYLKDSLTKATGYLQAVVTVPAPSGAPALTLANVNKSRIKANGPTPTTVFTGAALLNKDDVTDVEAKTIETDKTTDGAQYKSVQLQNETPTGIEGITADAVTIIGGEGMITVNGAKNVTVLNAMGQIIKQTTGKSEIDVPSGLYIVRADATTMKVLVK